MEQYEEIDVKFVEPLDVRLERWFSCADVGFVRQELNTLRRQSDLRDTDVGAGVYNKFMLVHYSLLCDCPEVFELIYEHECQIPVQQDTTVQLNNQCVQVKRGTNVIQLALTLNAVKCVRLFNKKVAAGEWTYEKEINDERKSALMVSCGLKNEAARLIWDNAGVINEELDYIDDQDQRLNVFMEAIEKDNAFVLDKLVQLASNANYTPIIFLIVLAFKNSGVSGFESGAIAKYLTRIALAYVQKAPTEDVEKMMTQFLAPAEWEQKRKQWNLLQECILQNYTVPEDPEQAAAEQKERLDLVLSQVEQQLYCMLSYQSQIFNERSENVQEEDTPKKTVWFDMCFGGQSLTPVRVLAPMCLKYRDPRITDLEGQLSFKGFTGLMYALMGNNTQVIEYLLQYEYDECLLQDEQVPTKFGTFLLKKGATPLHMACCVCDDLDFKLVQ